MKLTGLKIQKLHLSTSAWWLVSLIGVFVVTAILAVYAIVLFIGSLEADVVSENVNAPVESISRETLTETLTRFEARVRRFENLRANYAATPDPSL